MLFRSGEYQADERAGVAGIHLRVSGRSAGRCRGAPLASIRQMSGQVLKKNNTCFRITTNSILEKEMATHSSILAWKIPWTAAYQAPPSMGFSRQEYWSGVPLPSPHSSTLAWKIPWTEEPGGLQSMGS